MGSTFEVASEVVPAFDEDGGESFSIEPGGGLGSMGESGMADQTPSPVIPVTIYKLRISSVEVSSKH